MVPGSRQITFAAIMLATTALIRPDTSMAAEDACDSLTPAAIGGPSLPAASDMALLRWLGTANYELDYRGKVYLFDTY